ncbi:DNA N-6-adenine-methyltransferase [Shewanella sp. W3-18-1]|uniref:phage N-6-adenine-methyltransferase n=1 Tax=Shewanella sp. (strain W3-18-1) TaxID=351745 RepID=UPI00005FBDC5|nr:phage N-6-adenine-methyltransferase [Shewanella sp. W3-18-1]ABM25346.1 DNA N-6-adenine-methyltransferase [Shewanella sp. W3-18-1]
MSTKDSYRTPRAVYDFYDHQYHFVLDAAASDINARSPRYITEQQNTHETNWFHAAFGAPSDALGETHPEARTGHYVWMNPPYSNIGPFVETVIKWQAKGLGCVMLVMMDQSVGWFKRAVEHCQEVHLVIGGRLSFVDPVTEKPANGNNKGSMFLVFHPFGRPCDPRYRHIDRDEMLEGPVSLMRKSHSHIQGTIEQRSDDAEEGEQIGEFEAEQIDIDEQIARDSTVSNSVWPIEVMNIAKEVFERCGIKETTEIQFQELCEEANRQRLDGYPTDSIIDDLVMNMPTEKKPCAA